MERRQKNVRSCIIALLSSLIVSDPTISACPVNLENKESSNKTLAIGRIVLQVPFSIIVSSKLHPLLQQKKMQIEKLIQIQMSYLLCDRVVSG